MKNISKKRVLVGAGGLALLGTIVAAFCYAGRLIAVGTAYKAKMLCSEVFVAGRDPAAVLADLVIDDLAALQIIGTSIDNAEKSVTASFHGFVKSKARYRGTVGCALLSPEPGTVSSVSGTRENQDAPKYLPAKEERSVESIEVEGVGDPRLVAVLEDAFSEPEPEHPRRTRAVVIVHKGRIVAERYAADIGPDTPLLGWSMTKSVMNGLVGILVQAGRISLDALAPVDAWRAPGDARGRITLEHLMNMSSGLEFDEDMANPLSDVTRMLLKTRDMATFAAEKPLQAEPGTRWQYSSGSTNILSGVIRRVLGEVAYPRFARQALFDRIGMTSAVLETDASGTWVGSSFMYATARDWAKFGMLYLNDGVWQGERILPEGWVDYTRTAAPADSGKLYGAHFWLTVPAEFNRAQTALPTDAIHAIGHEGQFVTIIPSHDTVIVRLGKTRYPQAWDHGAFVGVVLSTLRAKG